MKFAVGDLVMVTMTRYDKQKRCVQEDQTLVLVLEYIHVANALTQDTKSKQRGYRTSFPFADSIPRATTGMDRSYYRVWDRGRCKHLALEDYDWSYAKSENTLIQRLCEAQKKPHYM